MSDRKFICETAVRDSFLGDDDFVQCHFKPVFRVKPDDTALDQDRWTLHCELHAEDEPERVPFDPALACGLFIDVGFEDDIQCGAPAVWIADEVLLHDLNRRALRCAEHTKYGRGSGKAFP